MTFMRRNLRGSIKMEQYVFDVLNKKIDAIQESLNLNNELLATLVKKQVPDAFKKVEEGDK